jgi:hypothetical protein
MRISDQVPLIERPRGKKAPATEQPTDAGLTFEKRHTRAGVLSFISLFAQLNLATPPWPVANVGERVVVNPVFVFSPS